MAFYVDTRENSITKRSLRSVGLPVVEKLIQTKGLGDFYWESPFGLFCVEHKSSRSLALDFFKRPTRQISDMIENKEFNGVHVIILAIEGIITEQRQGSYSGKTLAYHWNGKRFAFENPDVLNVNYNAFMAWKHMLSLKGILVLEYPNNLSLASGMRRMYDLSLDNEYEGEIKYKTANKGNLFQENVLMQFKGIGRAKAQRLLARYETLFDIFMSEGEGWPIKSPDWNNFVEQMSVLYE